MWGIEHQTKKKRTAGGSMSLRPLPSRLGAWGLDSGWVRARIRREGRGEFQTTGRLWMPTTRI